LEKIMANHNVTLEDILDALMLEEASPSYEALTRWSDRYPDYTDALAQFFAVWARQLDYEDEPAIEDNGSLTRRAVSYALDLMHRQDTQRKKPGGKGGLSLIKSARAAGLSLEEVALRTDLDISVIRKLDRCLIQEPIPSLCLERLSSTLDAPVQLLRTMVTGPPTRGARVRHKAKGKPALVTESFADAIRNSSLPEATRNFWLGIVSPSEHSEDPS
jgi:hypothetical protein